MKLIAKYFNKFEEYIICISFPIMVLLVIVSTCIRYFKLGSMPWAEEAARYLMIAMVFAGISIGFRDNIHLGMSFLVDKLPKSLQKIFIKVRSVLIITFGGLTGYFTWEIIKKQMKFPQMSPSMHIPMWIIYSIMLIGSVLLVIRSLQVAFQPASNNSNNSEEGF